MGLLPPPAPLILLSDVPGTNQTVPCTLTPQSLTPVPSTRTPNWSLRLWETRRPCRREKVGPPPPPPSPGRMKLKPSLITSVNQL